MGAQQLGLAGGRPPAGAWSRVAAASG